MSPRGGGPRGGGPGGGSFFVSMPPELPGKRPGSREGGAGLDGPQTERSFELVWAYSSNTSALATGNGESRVCVAVAPPCSCLLDVPWNVLLPSTWRFPASSYCTASDAPRTTDATRSFLLRGAPFEFAITSPPPPPPSLLLLLLLLLPVSASMAFAEAFAMTTRLWRHSG